MIGNEELNHALTNGTKANNKLYFYLNKNPVTLNNPNPEVTVLDYLRAEGLTGTKLGCGEGGCGACTVVLGNYDTESGQATYLSANACLTPLCSVNGKQVITVEGLGNEKEPHPIQERLAHHHGSQCGFCTPGIVMSLYGILRDNCEPSVADIEEGFDGNLCRCTGYRPILDAAKTFAKDNEEHKACTVGKSKQLGQCLVKDKTFKTYNTQDELQFPQELIDYKTNVSLSANLLQFTNELGYKWLRPSTIDQLIQLKNEFPKAKLIGGNTEVGIEMRLRFMEYKHLVYTGDIKEYTQLNVNDETLELGANITLNKLIKELKKALKLVKSHQASTLNALLTNLKWFAGNQIRNFATLAGNIITGSPISDLNPILIATGANLIVESVDGRRSIPMRELYTGYRKNALKENEVAISLEVPLAKEGEFVRAYKQAKRKDDDIAIANGCFKVQLKSTDNGYQVVDLHGGLGGVAPTTLYLNTLTNIAKDKVWGDETLLAAITDEILDKVKFDYTVPGGQPTYRRTLIVSFFKKFWLQTCKELSITCNISLEGLEDIERNVSFGVQRFDDSNFNKTLGSAQMHVSGLKQTTGVAKYVDDIPKQFNELFGALVISDKAHAKIKSIDYSEALKIPGVYKIDYKDVPGHNKFGAVIQDEEIFASEEVNTAGQIIAVMLADDKLIARKAANLVKIEYEVLPHVLTIQEAIDQDSIYPQYRHIGRGNLEEEFAQSDHIFEGEYYIAGQEHFYLETQGTLAIPKGEGQEIELISSNQGLNELQMVVAEALDIPFNRVVCKAKRLGGGFGGKESRGTPYGAVAAVAAHTLNRPVRVVLDRDTDMCSSGQRHPFLGKWKLGVTKEGKFKALDVTLYNNAGHSLDLSLGVMDRAVTHVDNCYFFPALNVVGKLAKTNTPSNTAYRGFGGPQGMIICEMMVSEVADKLGIDQLEIRKMNMYEEGQSTHFNNELLDWHVPEMWERILKQSNYTERRALVDKFNSENVWKKRGLAVTPTKFGISFGVKFLNQAGALVHIYTDGSVLLSHGGVEMGQGLHTKMTQICADTLGIPVEQVFISETSTDKVINAAPTAASASSDLNGYAIYNACVELRDRIKPYRDATPNATLKEWAKAAYFDRVNLSANGFYKTPDIGYDFETNQGLLFFYYTSGVSVSEVEIDVLTGDHSILRADIIMDIGQSINVATDIGQIEGAFIQGVGLTTIEEPLFHPDGRTFTKGPGNYKIPGFRDIPQEFYVDILEGKEYKNLKTIKRSKGVGEPPLFMGASVFFAIRDAIKQARLANGITEVLKLTSPATSEKIRLNCQDDLVNLSKVLPKNPTDKLWAHNI